jgi:hypothetical protein
MSIGIVDKVVRLDRHAFASTGQARHCLSPACGVRLLRA